ncbi:MAG: hypothetical protein GY756_04090 [bacterium]|nr:hypothetical protein [bacterium]
MRYILRPVFSLYNISFYYFIVFAKKIHPLDINTNCRIIDSELEKADIYIRCYDKNVEHKFRHIDQIHSSIIWNPFIGSFSQRNYDYLFYETEIASYEYFTNKYNRIELILLEESPAYSCPNPKMVTALYHSISESPFKFAEKVAEEVHFLYNILYPRIHFNIDNSQSGDDNG